MTILEFKEKELSRMRGLPFVDSAALAILEEEVRNLRLRDSGKDVQVLTPDDLVGDLQAETATVVGTIVTRKQVETLTVVGTISADGAGDATVTVTTALLQDPEVVSVAVANDDTAELVAGKVRTALGETENVLTHFDVSGEGAAVVLTAKVGAANDTTLNIAIDNDTCTGLTPVTTSTNTTAGHEGSGNASVVVTSAKVQGSPLTTSVAVLVGDSAEVIAGKIRTALGEVSAITSKFVVSGSGDKVVLTAKDYFANDPTLNIAISTGTAFGITTASTSADTTEGTGAKKALLVTSGNVFCVGDVEGFELELPPAANVAGQKIYLVKVDSGAGAITISTNASEKINGADTLVLANQYECAYVVSNGLHWYVISKTIA